MSDIVDRAQEREEHLRGEALHAHAAAAAGEVARRDRDGYRICADCFDRLTAKRLRARPEAVRCVECQGLFEQKQKRRVR